MRIITMVDINLVGIVALLFLVTGFSTASAQSVQDQVSAAARGKQLYYDHGCYGCHGYNGTGKNGTGNIPLSNGVSGILTSEDLFITFLRLRADQNPHLASDHMPNFGEEALSDVQAKDIYAYIKTIKDDRKKVEEIPAMMKILEAAEASRGKVN